MKKLLLQVCLCLTAGAIQAQVGIGTATPHASAQLDISASNKGLLIPRMAQASRPASPATGLMIFQTDNTPGYYYYDGSTWKMLGAATNTWNLDGNSGTTPAHFIGTTDAMPLVFKANGSRSGFIDINSSTAATFLVYEAGNNNTGLYNSAFGWRAMFNSTTANYNTAVGYAALYTNSTGHYNTAVGFEALRLNTATDNTAVGYQALRQNTTGGYNTAMGIRALANNTTGYENTALGNSALTLNETGNYNTGIGDAALLRNNTGSNNTAVGRAALFDLTDGSYNTAIGFEANVSSGSLNNSTAIGNGARVTASNMVRIGNSAVTVIGGAVGWSTLSDIRFKKDIAPETHGLDFIMQLQPITYHIDAGKLNRFTNSGNVKGGELLPQTAQQQEAILYSGFSAQQVEEAALATGYNFSGVHKPQSDKDHYSLDYASFVVPLVKAVQEQQEMIAALKKQNELLQLEINTLKQKRTQ
jgi:hypothetical protein